MKTISLSCTGNNSDDDKEKDVTYWTIAKVAGNNAKLDEADDILLHSMNIFSEKALDADTISFFRFMNKSKPQYGFLEKLEDDCGHFQILFPETAKIKRDVWLCEIPTAKKDILEHLIICFDFKI